MNKLIITGFVFATFLTGCLSDAPRTNPMDPAINKETALRISGKVTHLNNATQISGALISLKPAFVSARSNPNGEFVITGEFPAGDYTLICEATGFSTDSVSLALSPSVDLTQNFLLNALPSFSAISLLTRHEASLIPQEQEDFIDVSISVADGDGANDIQNVWLEAPAFSFRDTLQLLPQEQRYFARIRPKDMGVSDLETLQGKAFNIFVSDAHGAVVQSAPQFISRIINGADRTPVTIFPDGNASIPFDFQWQPFRASFAFTFRVEVFLNVNIALPPSAAINNISSDSTSVRFDAALAPGSYFWVLYVVDEFGNYSRSLKKALTIN